MQVKDPRGMSAQQVHPPAQGFGVALVQVSAAGRCQCAAECAQVKGSLGGCARCSVHTVQAVLGAYSAGAEVAEGCSVDIS